MAFKKLICNLLLNQHPICINKWMHPLLANTIDKFYLNYHTVWFEYTRKKEFHTDKINDISEVSISAAKFNNIIILKWCLKNSVIISDWYENLLYYATINGHLRIVKLLLERDININNNLLQTAVRYGNSNIVQLLLERGADVNNLKPGTLIEVIKDDKLRIVKLLLEYS